MKTRLASMLLAICMVLTLCPVPGSAASGKVSQGTALSETESSTQATTEAVSAENPAENTSESTAESSTESSPDGTAPDEAVSAAQAQIDVLPTAKELSAMDEEAFNAAGEQIYAAYDAYAALTEAQQAEITGAECFDTLFAVLNEGVSTMAGTVKPAGSGTADDPYLIGTADELSWFTQLVDGLLSDGTAQNASACAKLTADLTLTDLCVPINLGNNQSDKAYFNIPYQGTFDGAGYTISGWRSLANNNTNYQDSDFGMFGYIGAQGVVKNLNLSGSVVGYCDTGILCGSNLGTIENCSVSGTVSTTGKGATGTHDVGGICGYNAGTIKNCIFTGTSGGIVGSSSGTVENCYYLADSELDSFDGTTYKTAAQFASGEVAYLLNGSTSTGTLVWYQTIGTDSCPAFSGGTVSYGYYAFDSNGFKTLEYSNENTEVDEYEAVTQDSDGIYQIANAGQLYSFAKKVNAGETSISGKLTADIDLNPGYTFNSDGTYSGGTSPRAWTPIGSASKIFSGGFDGNGKTISGIYINNMNNYMGLIGRSSQGVISDLTITNSYIMGMTIVAAVCGKSSLTSISNCTVSASVYITADCAVGGICGESSGVINQCVNYATITGKTLSYNNYGVGGICGTSYGSTFTSCVNYGTITGLSCTGGICGNTEQNASSYVTTKIQNCANVGAISASSSYGGIFGRNDYGGTIVQFCFNTGTLANDATSFIYGSTTTSFTLDHCYYLAASESDSIDGTTYKTAEEFASGEVCYLLNGDQTTIVWYQTIGTDSYPTFSGETVYKGAYKNGIFDASLDGYTNTYQEYEAAVINNNGTTNDDTDDYYEIANVGQLCWFAAKVNAGDTAINGKLTADIDLNGVTWSGISNQSTIFSGTFDGGGFAISNMNSAKTNQSPGLIYALGTNGVVKNLTMKSAYTFDQNGQSKGIVVGENNGSIEAVFVTDSQITMGNYDGMGGIAGKNTGTISNCAVINVIFTRVWGAVEGNKVSGAITENNTGTVSNCYSYGITFVGGTTANAGALVAAGTAPVNSYYLSTDISTEKKVVAGVGGIAATAEQFASGEIAWLLNSSASTGVWKEDIDNGVTPYDAVPNFTGGVVYYSYNAYDTNGFGSTRSYSNTNPEETLYEPAVLKDGVYEISNAGQLYWFAQQVKNGNTSLNAKLMADIDMNPGFTFNADGTYTSTSTDTDTPRSWILIGIDNDITYAGTFNGNGKTVSGIYFNEEKTGCGLFGQSFGTISDLTVSNSYIAGSKGVGGICGSNAGAITRCFVTDSVYVIGNFKSSLGYGESKIWIGGICGLQAGGSISDCASAAAASGSTYVGGICGNLMGGTIANCYNIGTVSASSETLGFAGGVCGGNINGTVVTNAYYLEDCAKDGSGTVQYGIGNTTVGNTTADVAGSTTAKTADEFASGEVCWLLNGSASTGVWRQDIDIDTTPDASPNFAGAAVYYVESLNNKYSNSATGEIVFVDITWGSMTFTYQTGTWNSETCQYDGACWTPDEPNGNAVTVKNSGTAKVSATLSYTPQESYNSITGSFDSDVTADIPLGEEKKWLLSLSGKPAEAMSSAILGTVTVTIKGE